MHSDKQSVVSPEHGLPLLQEEAGTQVLVKHQVSGREAEAYKIVGRPISRARFSRGGLQMVVLRKAMWTLEAS